VISQADGARLICAYDKAVEAAENYAGFMNRRNELALEGADKQFRELVSQLVDENDR
jgi:hypothetical protein